MYMHVHVLITKGTWEPYNTRYDVPSSAIAGESMTFCVQQRKFGNDRTEYYENGYLVLEL